MDGISAWVEERSAPVAATVMMLVGVMAFSLLGHAALHVGRGHLVSPSDLWSLAASSSAILHAHLADIYMRNGALTSPPALELVLVPVLALGQLLGLSPHLHNSGEPLSLWFVLGPAAVLLASTALFAIDATARYWGFSDGRRLVLALVGALGVANVAGGWGHPEDCVAVALVVWAALALERGGSDAAPRAALLLGVGIAFQPLALLGVAPVLARLSWRAAARLSWRLALPSVVVLIPPLVAETHRTLFVLARQPFQPKYISLTPLTHLAPVIGPGLHGGGPTRLIAIVLGAALAVRVCHRDHDLDRVLAMASVAFFLRVLLETELNWYYLWPVPALCLVLSLRRSTLRFGLCTTALVATMVLGDRRVHDIVLWWPALMAALVVMLASIGPSPRRWAALVTRRREQPIPAGPLECGAMVPAGVGLRRE
jgi:hypothetical protein